MKMEAEVSVVENEGEEILEAAVKMKRMQRSGDGSRAYLKGEGEGGGACMSGIICKCMCGNISS